MQNLLLGEYLGREGVILVQEVPKPSCHTSSDIAANPTQQKKNQLLTSASKKPSKRDTPKGTRGHGLMVLK